MADSAGNVSSPLTRSQAPAWERTVCEVPASLEWIPRNRAKLALGVHSVPKLELGNEGRNKGDSTLSISDHWNDWQQRGLIHQATAGDMPGWMAAEIAKGPLTVYCGFD